MLGQVVFNDPKVGMPQTQTPEGLVLCCGRMPRYPLMAEGASGRGSPRLAKHGIEAELADADLAVLAGDLSRCR